MLLHHLVLNHLLNETPSISSCKAPQLATELTLTSSACFLIVFSTSTACLDFRRAPRLTRAEQGSFSPEARVKGSRAGDEVSEVPTPKGGNSRMTRKWKRAFSNPSQIEILMQMVRQLVRYGYRGGYRQAHTLRSAFRRTSVGSSFSGSLRRAWVSKAMLQF